MGLVKARRWWWWWCVEKRKNTFHTVTIFSNKSFQFFLSWKDFVLFRAPLSLIIMLIYSAFCLRILEQSWNQNNKSWMVAKIKATICFCVWKSSSNFPSLQLGSWMWTCMWMWPGSMANHWQSTMAPACSLALGDGVKCTSWCFEGRK